MKALTLQRPWPGAIARLGKRIENRTWAAPRSIIGQRIAIHAGAAFDREGTDWIWRVTGAALKLAEPQGIVMTVLVTACYPIDALPLDLRSLWACGPECWILADPIVLPKPITCRGALGLWTVPPEIERRLPL